ncbi:MAG: sulfatase [Verrucomicrobiota bacterium]
MNRTLLSFFAPFLLFFCAADAAPNFLLIIGDDCTYNDLPLYGGENAKTPNLNAMAERGLVFNQAYLATAMCQPCRAELYSGQYPISNGCAWNHSASRPETRSLPHFLRPLGYRVGIAGKVHVKPAEAFPFDAVEGFDKSCVRDPTEPHDLAPSIEYMKGETPFCLVIGLTEPHIPWVMGDASQYPPKRLKLPPNLADTPVTREHFADYLAEITYMDEQVGDILEALEASGKRDQTLVLFTSEQGSQFPGCKWTNWNTGIHTALIAEWPGTVPAGMRTDALVQYADIAPTFVALAGGESESQWDGTSFATVLRGEAETHRKFAFGVHNNLPEGPAYPIRSVTDGKFRYIRNLLPEELYIEKHLMGGGRLNNPYWATWMGDDPIKEPNTYEQIKRYMRRPPEQLYQTLEDPYEMENLAEDSGYGEIKAKLSAALDRWMNAEGDPGAAVDTAEALKAARRGEHLH